MMSKEIQTVGPPVHVSTTMRVLFQINVIQIQNLQLLLPTVTK